MPSIQSVASAFRPIPPLDPPPRLATVVPDPEFVARARRAREGVALIRTKLSSLTPTGPVTVERVFWLDPLAVEIVLEDARWSGEGTRLEIQIDPGTPPEIVARIRGRLAELHRRGIAFDVRRGRAA